MTELWKPVVGYEGIYEVSNMGRIRSLDREITHYKDGFGIVTRRIKGKELIPKIDSRKYYLFVSLSKDGVVKETLVHRIVATAFVENPDNLPQVNHKDENKKNNKAENLEWCTHKYNSTYGSRATSSNGENNAMNRFNEETIREIKQSYIPNDKEFGISGLAKKYGMSQTHVCAIIKGRRWGWLQ